MAKKKLSYTEALNELETIVDKLEDDATDIDELTKLTHRATELINFCRDKLRNTESELKTNME